MLNSRRILSGLAIGVLASSLVYALLAAATDVSAARAAIASLPLRVIAAMLGLGILCFVVRGIRWWALMRVAGREVSLVDGVYLQLAGQTMSVSPGRVGEVLKPMLARELTGMPVSVGVALVFAERVADLAAVCVLSLGGLTVLRGGSWWFLLALAAVLVGTAVAGSEWFHRIAVRVASRQRWAREHRDSLEEVSRVVRAGLSWRVLAWSIPASVVAWGAEGVGFALCIDALGFHSLPMGAAVSIYAISTIVGALTFLPGGIGLTEASLAGLLIAVGMGGGPASAATVTVRLATLWWGVGVGWLALVSRPGLLHALWRNEPEAD